MRKKKKRVAYVIIILIAVIVFCLYLLFLGGNKQYDYIPFVIGSYVVFAFYYVKCSSTKAKEWYGKMSKKNEKKDDDFST